MSQEDIFINGELLRLRREARGWVLNDMATRACMSVKQIRQIEEGGMSSFYSSAVKVTAAKKVGALLGLSAEEVFAQTVESVVLSDDNAMDALLGATEDVSESQVDQPDVAHVAVGPEKQTHHSEPESLTVTQESTVLERTKASAAPEPQEPVTAEEAPKSKLSLWLMVALLGLAWAGATYWQPHDEPVTEPVPPLQVLPAEDSASSASAAEGAASAAVESAVVAASMPASSALLLAPKPVASAVAPVVLPVASAVRAPASAPAARSASASSALPAALPASKAP